MSQIPPPNHPEYPSQSPPTRPGAVPSDPTAVRVSILVSAIFNLVTATWLALTCFGIVLSVPLVVLAIFEILHFKALGQPPYGPKRARAQVLGILEICTILAGNLGSLVCGIIVLVFLDRVRD
jgi:hypothetical protein